MGPPGALGITIATTFFSYFFALGCSDQGCPPLPIDSFFRYGLTKYTSLDGLLSLFDLQAAILYASWYAFTVVCWLLLPGKWVPGITLRNGDVLLYKING